jgi:hypothetical protein
MLVILCTVYGVGDIEQQLRRAGKGCVLGDRSPARPRTSLGRGGRPIGNACRQWPEPNDRGCTIGAISNWPISRSKNFTAQIMFGHEVCIRRHIADGDLAFFTTWRPAGTLMAVEGHRWAIEDSFEIAKNEFGLDHNGSRSWHEWHRHVSLVMLAFAMMAVNRHRPIRRPKKETPNQGKTSPIRH